MIELTKNEMEILTDAQVRAQEMIDWNKAQEVVNHYKETKEVTNDYYKVFKPIMELDVEDRVFDYIEEMSNSGENNFKRLWSINYLEIPCYHDAIDMMAEEGW